VTDQQKQKITIIGLGLIGGSLGMALKAASLSERVEIVGHDRDSGVESIAKKRAAIDHAEHNLPRAVEGAALVIVATPITTIAEVFQQIAPHLAPGAVVCDTASTKAQVMGWAADILPDNVSFVGGHPMAGKETSGIEASDPTLFQGRAYCVCPSVSATPTAIKQITGLAQLVGAEPLFMDAEEHDQYAAAISHLPLVVSTALFTLMRSSPSWDDLGAMASSGFRDVTRLASGDPEMSMGIWMTNREAMIHWLERMIAELGRFREMLKDAQDEALLRTFSEARFQREQFLAEPPRRQMVDDGPKLDKSRLFMEMFLGGKLAENLERMKDLPKVMDQRAKEAKEASEGRAEKRKRSFAEKIEDGVRRDLEKLSEREDAESGKTQDP
jgi:prephenate dehydrogenase